MKIPSKAKSAARQALQWREQYGRGGTETGIQRAEQLIRHKAISSEEAETIFNWFQRHKHFRPHHSRVPEPSNSLISWQLWGGDAMYKAVSQYISRNDLSGTPDEPTDLRGAQTESTLKGKSRESGIPKSILQDVYNRGVGAYKNNFSAVRPHIKAMPEAQGKAVWAMARVNKFIKLYESGGWENVYKPDQDLAKKIEE